MKRRKEEKVEKMMPISVTGSLGVHLYSGRFSAGPICSEIIHEFVLIIVILLSLLSI